GVQERPVAFQDAGEGDQLAQGFAQGGGLHEIGVVGRGMVFRETPVRGGHQAARGQVESGRAELPLVVSERGKILDGMSLPGLVQGALHGAVYAGGAAAAAFVGGGPGVAEQAQDQSVPDEGGVGSVAAEPGYGSDGG